MQHILALNFQLKVTKEIIKSSLPDLTSRQLAILLIVYLDSNSRRVKEIAKELKVSKPVISRALDKLESLNLVRRKDDPLDGRSIIVHRTMPGSSFLTELSDIINAAEPNKVNKQIDSRAEESN